VKKKVGLLVGLMLLTACDETANEESLPEEEAMEEGQVEMSDLEEESSAVEFLPQEGEVAQGLDTQSDPLLEEVDNYIQSLSEDELAEPGNVGLRYTGLTIQVEDSDEVQAILVLTNLMDDGIAQMEMTFSFGASEEELFIEEDTVILEESFGILEPYTARPLYITLTEEDQERLAELEPDAAYVEIHNFDYEIAGEEERNP
jgi:hypothetical protein